MSDIRAFLSEQFFPLFHRGVALLAAEPELQQDVLAVRQATRLTLEGPAGARDLFVGIQAGQLSLSDTPPADLPVRAAIALPEEAAQIWLQEIILGEDLTSDAAALRATKVVSQRLDDAIGDEPLEMHLILTDTPDFDEVVVRIGLGIGEAPEEPEFTATVDWESLQEARQQGGGPQQLMMGGGLRLGGDYARAMELAVTLMTESG